MAEVDVLYLLLDALCPLGLQAEIWSSILDPSGRCESIRAARKMFLPRSNHERTEQKICIQSDPNMRLTCVEGSTALTGREATWSLRETESQRELTGSLSFSVK